jgi:C4-dicarboxylate-specific signal transduction histidine kinase
MGAEGLKNVHHSDVPITKRQTVSHDPLATCLDRLLVTICEIRPGASLEEVAQALVQVGSEVLTDAAIGVCIPDEHGGQIVVRHSSRISVTQAPNPSHLFPEFVHERVVPIPFDESSTLHLATDDESRFAQGSSTETVIDRIALTLGAAIRQCRTSERAREGEAEMRGLENQVIQSEKLASLGQIAAGIVHELNNPLTSIVAYSDYLRKKCERTGADPADIERLLRINEAAERILRFSRDLIAYSRPSSEVPAPVMIHEIIDRALVFCEHVLDETGVMVERNFGEVRSVQGVAGQLTQVFVNLFTNACQAMRDHLGGCLSITTGMNASNDQIVVTIVDDGHGIPDDHVTRIFDPFFTTKTDGSGTGLGLSIVRNIVLRHRGRIQAAGNDPRGTIFRVELPAANDPTTIPD